MRKEKIGTENLVYGDFLAQMQVMVNLRQMMRMLKSGAETEPPMQVKE